MLDSSSNVKNSYHEWVLQGNRPPPPVSWHVALVSASCYVPKYRKYGNYHHKRISHTKLSGGVSSDYHVNFGEVSSGENVNNENWMLVCRFIDNSQLLVPPWTQHWNTPMWRLNPPTAIWKMWPRYHLSVDTRLGSHKTHVFRLAN